jgi:hypothetical protein
VCNKKKKEKKEKQKIKRHEKNEEKRKKSKVNVILSYVDHTFLILDSQIGPHTSLDTLIVP